MKTNEALQKDVMAAIRWEPPLKAEMGGLFRDGSDRCETFSSFYALYSGGVPQYYSCFHCPHHPSVVAYLHVENNKNRPDSPL
jgi:hypothetical protein